ncbi:RES domain-containing protein [Legionella birminghamensis]|uniref:RES domain-containing protein n=1 Tax=Legionella birminghamensis TaxID=28083 RepID=A0A378I9X0_9GAMM|nr:RES family NAD+ phosphorylase [Legionella birminghamensis]KTC69313.1 RES domain-containing protein [Legionella birminghamensis]STX31575.1 RES domain-containing protein [Legionella birminghamensis]
MDYEYIQYRAKTHRLIPSRYPPVSLFDWAENEEELEQIALLEGLTNDRLAEEYGKISLVPKGDWVYGPGATPLMAAFTHFGVSRFSDGSSYGVYYAADSVETAIAETKFHREQFLAASKEKPCIIQMREYQAKVTKELINICSENFAAFYNPSLESYAESQEFGRTIKINNEWGILYPSARKAGGKCIAVFRPPALTIPVQAGHYDYIWDGNCISEIRKSILCMESA